MKCAVLLLACSTLFGQQIYDLLLKNGRVVDTANHRNGQPVDIAIIGNKIVRVAANLPEAHAHIAVDVSGYMVSPGLIDIETHFAAPLKPDYNTLPYGVTTAVDSGTANCEVIAHAKVRLLVYGSGTCGAGQDAIPGTAPAPQPALRFGVARDAVARKAYPATISSGMDWSNILIPRANLSNAMSIYLNLGMTAEQIIERVTSNAARAIQRRDLGNLSEGSVADVAILEVQEGKFGFLDSAKTRLDGTRRFHCVMTVRNGAVVWDSAGLSITDTLKAGPYTNFK